MEEALYEITPMRQFARLTLSAPIPEDTTIMNVRHLLEKHKLAPAILAVINGYLQEKGLSLGGHFASSWNRPPKPQTYRKAGLAPGRLVAGRRIGLGGLAGLAGVLPRGGAGVLPRVGSISRELPVAAAAPPAVRLVGIR